MSATLTWASSGAGAKTGTAVGNFFTDLKTLVDSKSADATFSWEVSASSLASTPYYVWLRPKSGANGRILLISWTSAPAGNNSAILAGTPATTITYGCYFPNGTAASPSNLTASSGSISGDDTDCIGATNFGTTTTIYAASTVHFYFDSAEAIWFLTQNPSTSSIYCLGIGNIVVDANDVAYPAIYSPTSGTFNNFGSNSSPPIPWTNSTSGLSYPTASPAIKTNYGTAGAAFFHAWAPTAGWGTLIPSSTDILTDTTNLDVWFVPMQLMSQTKGGGFPLKLRQVGIGPGTNTALASYSTSGPVTAARQATINTSGNASGAAWFTNFKI